jgi:hypothetical protein
MTVDDLDAAIRDYEAAGFTVIPGGEHLSGTSHNALVTFDDGAYFEIFAFKASDEAHHWWPKAKRREGLVDFCLAADDLDAEYAAIVERGVELRPVIHGGRNRLDGIRLEWKTIRAASLNALLPFAIEDVTERSLRVPGGAASAHAAGFTGVAGIVLAVPSLSTILPGYQRYLGQSGEAVVSSIPGGGAAWRFALTNHWIELAEPGTADGPLRTIVETHGGGPAEIVLNGGPGGYLDDALTHGVPIRSA